MANKLEVIGAETPVAPVAAQAPAAQAPAPKKVLVKLIGNCTGSKVQESLSESIAETIAAHANAAIAVFDFTTSRENGKYVADNFEGILYKLVATEKTEKTVSRFGEERKVFAGAISEGNLAEAEKALTEFEAVATKGEVVVLIKCYSTDQKNQINEWMEEIGYNAAKAEAAILATLFGKAKAKPKATTTAAGVVNTGLK